MRWFAKMIFDRGGGKRLKKQRKSSGYFYKKFKKLKNLYKKLTFACYDIMTEVGSRARCDTWTQLFRKILCENGMPIHKEGFRAQRVFHDALTFVQKPAKLNSQGAILIEFAICMPVLIILLFYINDLVKIKRYYSQTEFVAQQMANILQNISKNNAITINDVKRAASLACLSMYPGKTMYFNGKTRGAHDFSHYPKFHIHYVKGLSKGKASCIWALRFNIQNGVNPSEWGYTKMTSTDSDSKVTWGSNLDQSTIYPTLKVDENKYKIIVECAIYCGVNSMNDSEYVSTDDQSTRSRKAFKCRLVTPKSNGNSNDHRYYFNSIVIFEPKPRLFSETAPQ